MKSGLLNCLLKDRDREEVDKCNVKVFRLNWPKMACKKHGDELLITA